MVFLALPASLKMKSFAAPLLSLLLLLGSSSAHTIFQKLYVNGVDQGELVGIRAPDYDGVCAFRDIGLDSEY